MTRSSPTCALLLTPVPLLMPLSVPEGLRPLLRTNLAYPWSLFPYPLLPQASPLCAHSLLVKLIVLLLECHPL